MDPTKAVPAPQARTGRPGARHSRTVQRMDADTRDPSEGADVVVILGQNKAP